MSILMFQIILLGSCTFFFRGWRYSALILSQQVYCLQRPRYSDPASIVNTIQVRSTGGRGVGLFRGLSEAWVARVRNGTAKEHWADTERKTKMKRKRTIFRESWSCSIARISHPPTPATPASSAMDILNIRRLARKRPSFVLNTDLCACLRGYLWTKSLSCRCQRVGLRQRVRTRAGRTIKASSTSTA